MVMLIRPILKKIRNLFFKQKYRFDLGMQFMVFLNFTLLVMTASDKIKLFIPLPTKYLVLILVPTAFIIMWSFGYILDKFVKSQHHQENESISRSPAWRKLFTRLDELEKKIDNQK